MERGTSEETKTLLEWAARLHPETPRKRIKSWLVDRRFFLDGVVVTNGGLRLPDPGNRLTFGPANPVAPEWGPRRRIHPKLVLVSLEADLAIVEKEAGLLSVPSNKQAGRSALDILGDYLNGPRSDVLRRTFFGSTAPVKPLALHRLDQYTSGLLCIAFNQAARTSLIEQLRRHEFLREYVAYVKGLPAEPSGTWRNHLLLDDSGQQTLVPAGTPDAVEATTHYKVERFYPEARAARLRLRLETGLKHQIRIQAAAHDLPLIGERTYLGGNPADPQPKKTPARFVFDRQALHAATLGIKHPADGRALHFQSHIPRDLQQLEGQLQGR